MSEKSPNLHSCKHAHDSDPPSVVNKMRSSDSSLSSLSTKWPVFILRSSKIRSLKVATASHIQSCWFHQAKSPSDSHTNTHHQSSFGLRGLSQLFSSILQGNQWLTSIASQSCQGTGCQQWSHHINCNCWTCVNSTPTNQWASWWVHVWEQQLKKQEESEGNEKESELRGKRNTQMETMKRKEGQDVDGKQEEWKTARNWKQKKQKRDKKLLHWRADALQHVLREGWWWQWTIFGRNQTAQQQWRQQIGSQVWWLRHKLEDSEPPNELIGGQMMALGQLILNKTSNCWWLHTVKNHVGIGHFLLIFATKHWIVQLEQWEPWSCSTPWRFQGRTKITYSAQGGQNGFSGRSGTHVCHNRQMWMFRDMMEMALDWHHTQNWRIHAKLKWRRVFDQCACPFRKELQKGCPWPGCSWPHILHLQLRRFLQISSAKHSMLAKNWVTYYCVQTCAKCVQDWTLTKFAAPKRGVPESRTPKNHAKLKSVRRHFSHNMECCAVSLNGHKFSLQLFTQRNTVSLQSVCLSHKCKQHCFAWDQYVGTKQ